MGWRDDGGEEPRKAPHRDGWRSTEGLASIGSPCEAEYCCVADCERPVEGEGLCAAHYKRLIRGSPSMLEEILPARTPWDRLYDALGLLWVARSDGDAKAVKAAGDNARRAAIHWALSLGWSFDAERVVDAGGSGLAEVNRRNDAMWDLDTDRALDDRHRQLVAGTQRAILYAWLSGLGWSPPQRPPLQ